MESLINENQTTQGFRRLFFTIGKRVHCVMFLKTFEHSTRAFNIFDQPSTSFLLTNFLWKMRLHHVAHIGCCDTYSFLSTVGDVRMMATSPPPNIFQFQFNLHCQKVGQKSAILQESLPLHFSWPFFSNNSWPIGQNAPPPQTESVSAHHCL